MKRVVAFAYKETLPELSALYRSCAEGLVRNIRGVMPSYDLVHVTDDKTKPIDGCHVLRVGIDALPMTWRLLAQHFAHSVADEILFTEPDVRFQKDPMPLLDDQSFDVTLCDREEDTIYGGESALKIAPYTQGCSFSRSPDFWLRCAEYCNTLDRKKQLWFGDMLAVTHVVKSEEFKVRILDASIYNHVPKQRGEESEANVVHYKGKRKAWLFPEAA